VTRSAATVERAKRLLPVVSALVMPAGLLGLVAMPFGFDGLFWWLMGIGIDWMTAVTRWVAALPGEWPRSGSDR
jgi:hypothetical protein